MAADVRACFGHLLGLDGPSCEAGTLSRAVDQVLGCRQRYACRSHLACSWVAAELAAELMRRYR